MLIDQIRHANLYHPSVERGRGWCISVFVFMYYYLCICICVFVYLWRRYGEGGGGLDPDPGLVASKEACHDMERPNMYQICIKYVSH